jgi:hypothetical protein
MITVILIKTCETQRDTKVSGITNPEDRVNLCVPSPKENVA